MALEVLEGGQLLFGRRPMDARQRLILKPVTQVGRGLLAQPACQRDRLGNHMVSGQKQVRQMLAMEIGEDLVDALVMCILRGDECVEEAGIEEDHLFGQP